MLRKIERMLDGIGWRRVDVLAFVGPYLTEPTPDVLFERSTRPLSAIRDCPSGAARGLTPPLGLDSNHLRWLYPWYWAGYIKLGEA